MNSDRGPVKGAPTGAGREPFTLDGETNEIRWWLWCEATTVRLAPHAKPLRALPCAALTLGSPSGADGRARHTEREREDAGSDWSRAEVWQRRDALGVGGDP